MIHTILILLTFLGKFISQDINHDKIVKAFMQDLNNPKIELRDVINQNLCTVSANMSKEQLEVVLLQLEYIRKQLTTTNQKIKIDHYSDLPIKQRILLIDKNEEKHTFKVKAGTNIVYWVLIKDNKVASFATLNKGTKKVIMKLCD